MDQFREDLLAFIQRLPPADEPETADEVADRVGAGIAAAAKRRRQREADMPKLTPRFDPVFNWGHVITVMSIVGGFAIAYSNYTAEMAAVKSSIAAADIRASRYIPIIDQLGKSNDVQDERIQNLAIAVADLRRSNQEAVVDVRRANAEIMGILGTLREDMAQVKAKLSIERR